MKAKDNPRFKYYRLVAEHDEQHDMLAEFIIDSMLQLYDCPMIRKHLKSAELSYFMNHLERVYSASYVPTIDDMLRCHRPTADMRELIKEGDENTCAVKVVEISGSRYARRRWIQSLERFETIVFLASALHYRFGPEFEESVTFFETVCNSRLFTGSRVVLVFSHVDALQEELRSEGDGEYRSILDHLTERYFEVAQKRTLALEADFTDKKSTASLVQSLL